MTTIIFENWIADENSYVSESDGFTCRLQWNKQFESDYKYTVKSIIHQNCCLPNK